jgi:diacylglycerol kinase
MDLFQTSMKKFIQSFLYAIKGISVSMKEQRSLKIQMFVAVITLGAGFYFRISDIEWCIVLLSIGLVIGFEMINTAIENLVNLVTTERKPLAGKVKDIAAGAVLVVAIMAVIVGLVIFGKYII